MIDDEEEDGLERDEGRESEERFVRWKSVPEILILPSLVKQELNEEEERAEMMVMQQWSPEEVKQTESELDSMRLIPHTHSPGVIVHEDRNGHTLEEELKQALSGVVEDESPVTHPLPSGSSTLH